MERLVAVAMPLKVGRLSTPFRMRCVVAVLSLVCVALSLFPLWTLHIDPVYVYCSYPVDSQDEYRAWLLAVRRLGTLALPITLLVICSGLIVYFLARAHHTRPQVQRLLLLLLLLLSCGVACVIPCLAVLIQYRCVTDRRTDRHTTTASTALA